MKLNNEKLKKDGATRFQLSVIFLFVTFSIVILFSLFYFLLTFDINETSGLGLFVIGIIIMYSGLIASGISSISALCGSLLGISSVKYLSAKKDEDLGNNRFDCQCNFIFNIIYLFSIFLICSYLISYYKTPNSIKSVRRFVFQILICR